MERSPGKHVSSYDDACSTQAVSHHADHFSDGAEVGPRNHLTLVWNDKSIATAEDRFSREATPSTIPRGKIR